jgi:hypothetical protein
MSEETAPDVTQETPQTTEPEIDYKKRYEDLRPEFDRTSQELAEWKRIKEDDEARAEWLKSLGYEISADEELDEDEIVDDEPQAPKPDPRVDVALNQLGEIRYERDLTKFLEGRDLSEKGRNVVDALCVQGGNGPDALKKAVDTWFELQAELVPEEPETTKPAPHVLNGGKTATSVKDWSEMSRDEIDDEMVSRVRAADAQT